MSLFWRGCERDLQSETQGTWDGWGVDRFLLDGVCRDPLAIRVKPQHDRSIRESLETLSSDEQLSESREDLQKSRSLER